MFSSWSFQSSAFITAETVTNNTQPAGLSGTQSQASPSVKNLFKSSTTWRTYILPLWLYNLRQKFYPPLDLLKKYFSKIFLSWCFSLLHLSWFLSPNSPASIVPFEQTFCFSSTDLLVLTENAPKIYDSNNSPEKDWTVTDGRSNAIWYFPSQASILSIIIHVLVFQVPTTPH